MTAHAPSLLLSLSFAATLLGGCSKPPSEATVPAGSAVQKQPHPAAWFEEVAAQAGVTFHHSSGHENRFLMPESMVGGVGLIDYDRDGLLDIFCVNGGSLVDTNHLRGHHLYHNLGNWKFEDVTERAGVAGRGDYGVGVACGDYDGDGWPDIHVNNLGRNLLYRNNHDGTFTDVTESAGVGDVSSWSVSAAFFDYDNDGHMDLIVVNYVRWSLQTEVECFSYGSKPDYCSPLAYKAPSVATLYHNRGDGTFENVTHAAGLDKAYGNGLGVVCADFNGDGRCDIFIANDAVPNQLWINQGNGTFIDQAMIRGCAVNAMGVSRAGMGIAVADLNADGWLDLFVTHLVSEGNGLFLNDNGVFADTIRPKGPSAPSLPFTGFGVGFFDFDNDGNLDLFVANGRVKRAADSWDPTDPYAEPNTLLRGMGGLDFEEVLPRGGTDPALIATSRGAAFGDLNNDGGVDIVVLNRDGPVHVLRNKVSGRGHWILLHVIDRKGRDAINARLEIVAGAKRYSRQVLPNQSYASSNDPRVHCGLGFAERVDEVVVHWPGGSNEVFGPFKADAIYELRQGSGTKPR